MGKLSIASKFISQERHHDAAILFGSGETVSKWLDPLMTGFIWPAPLPACPLASHRKDRHTT
jgi:hypothetical protein